MEGQEVESDLQLQWLKPFIQAPFYVHCECGSQKYTNHFCSDCKGLPFCDKCKISNPLKHYGHKVLRVCKASHETGIRIFRIRKLFDVSDIQPYIINSHRIVYLLRRQSKGKNKQEENRGGNKCEILCGWSSLSSPAKFCSIECKEKWLLEEQKRDACPKQEQSTDQKQLPLKKEEYVAPEGSFRKKPRKGDPVRSPLM